MNNPESETQNQFTVYWITGDGPGAGQSSGRKMLCEAYGITRWFYAGTIRRSIALMRYEQADKPWDEFVTDLIELPNIPVIDENEDFNEAILEALNDEVAAEPENKGLVIDYITDALMLKAAYNAIFEQESAVIEGKLAVIIDKIFNNTDFRLFALPSILLPMIENAITMAHIVSANEAHIQRVLLLAPPLREAAKRVNQRRIATGELTPPKTDQECIEQLDDTEARIAQRINSDWERFEKMYGISKEDLCHPNAIIVDTQGKTLDEVFEAITNKTPVTH